MKVQMLLDLLGMFNPDAEIRVHAMSAGFDQTVLSVYCEECPHTFQFPMPKTKFVDIDVGERSHDNNPADKPKTRKKVKRKAA